MDLKLLLLVIVGIALAVTWIIEWAKGPFPKVPSLVWWAVMPVLCFALALACVVGLELKVPFLGFIILGALAWAVCQAGYMIFVQHLPRIIKAQADQLEAIVIRTKNGT